MTLVCDLGSGDGRILIAAAKNYGAHGVGIEIDPERVREATANARAERRRRQGDVSAGRSLHRGHQPGHRGYAVCLSGPVNSRLKGKLMKDLKPGTRIVSHAFDLGDWKPQQRVMVSGRPIYFWTIPRPS